MPKENNDSWTDLLNHLQKWGEKVYKDAYKDRESIRARWEGRSIFLNDELVCIVADSVAASIWAASFNAALEKIDPDPIGRCPKCGEVKSKCGNYPLFKKWYYRVCSNQVCSWTTAYYDTQAKANNAWNIEKGETL